MKKKILRGIVAAVFWAAVWFAAAALTGSELILPSPVSTFGRLFSLAAESEFWKSVGMTLVRVVLGMICGCAAGILLAVFASLSDIISSVLSPAVSVVRASPVASFIILVMLWLGNRATPSVISALMVLPVVYVDVLTGLSEVKKEYTEVAAVFGFRRKDLILKVYLPSLRPYLYSALKNSVGLSWKSGVAAEVLSLTPLSIGRNIMAAKNYLETPDLFAWTLTVVVLSILIEKAVFARLPGKTRRDGAKK